MDMKKIIEEIVAEEEEAKRLQRYRDIIITCEWLHRAAGESHTASGVSILYICRVLGHLS
jgi:hypothetical protein